MSQPPEPPSTAGSTVFSIIMILAGGALLLPGLCAGYYMLMLIGSLHDPTVSKLVPLWLVCFAVSAGGVVLIVWALFIVWAVRRR